MRLGWAEKLCWALLGGRSGMRWRQKVLRCGAVQGWAVGQVSESAALLAITRPERMTIRRKGNFGGDT